MSKVMAGFESYLSEVCGLSKQVLRNFSISFSKSKVELLKLWGLSFSHLSYLNFGSLENTLRHVQMNFITYRICYTQVGFFKESPFLRPFQLPPSPTLNPVLSQLVGFWQKCRSN